MGFIQPAWPAALQCALPGAEAKDEAPLILLEQNWAQALQRHDSKTVSCILADEFEDADVDGRLHNREQALAQIAAIIAA